MNIPPDTFVRVPPATLQSFASRAARAVGMPIEKADLLAELLTACDLRGVFSHGTQQIAAYARLMRDGSLNPNPQVRVVHETPVSLLVDGDGGLGYFAAHQAGRRAVEKARQQGAAVAVTRNHGHVGAAGLYARLPLAHDLLTFVTSGHQLRLTPDQSVYGAGGGSPMSFSAPAGEEDALVLDFGAMHDLYRGSALRDELPRKAPGLAFRAIGLGACCQAWGGLLAGIPFDPERALRDWSGANQGSLLFTFKIDLFLPPRQFKREMDEYVRAVRAMQPLEGFDQASLPGGIEAAREREYRRDGIPVGPQHQQALEELARELRLETPWGSGE